MVTSVIFLIKNNLNRHNKHENLLSIYDNMDYFQIMLFIVSDMLKISENIATIY